MLRHRGQVRVTDTDQLFSLLIKEAKDYAIVTLDPQGFIQDWNDGVRRITGYDAGEITGQHVSSFYSAAGIAAGTPSSDLARAESEGRLETEGWRQRKDGTAFWARLVLTALRNPDGTLRGFALILRDNSATRETEDALRTVLNSVYDGILLHSTDGVIIDVNERCLQMYGVNREQMLRMTVPDLSSVSSPLDSLPGLWARVMSGTPEFFEWKARRPNDNSEFDVEVFLRRIHIQGQEAVLANVRDITGRKQAEEKLRRSEERFRTLAEAIPQLVWSTNAKGEVDYVNSRWQSYTGLSPQESFGQGWLKAVHPDDAAIAEKAWLVATTEQKPYDCEYRLRRHDGEFRWFSARALPLAGQRGLVHRWFGTSTDIHDQKKALVLRDEFLSIASHELKTPLTALKLELELSQRKFLREASQYEPCAKFGSTFEGPKRQVDRLNGLVEHLLDVSRIQTGKLTLNPEAVDLSALVGEVLERFQYSLEQAQCALTLELAPNIVGYWDKIRIEQIAINLIANAVKYAPGSQVLVKTFRHNGNAMLVVQDFGTGIEKRMQTAIFERFGRASNARGISGLGLGLFIARKMAERHGGRILLESEPGKGSKFTVELPLKPAYKALAERDTDPEERAF